MSPSVRRTLASLGAWLAGAGVAVAVGILALSLIGGGLASGEVRPVPEDEPVVVAPTASPSPAPSVSPSIALAPPMTQSAAPTSAAPSSAPPSPASGTLRQLASVGGSVTARCAGLTAYLVSWSPAQGYEADEVHRGPGRVASVVFQGDGQRVWLGVHCVAGIPERTSDWHRDN